MQILEIDRIMVATPSIDDAREQFESLLGVSFGPALEADVEIGDSVQHTEVSYAEPGIEVITPDDEENGVAQFLDRHGPGLFGIVFRVDDIEAVRDELSAADVEPIAVEEPKGVVELHYHPEDFGGLYTVLTEYTHPGFAADES